MAETDIPQIVIETPPEEVGDQAVNTAELGGQTQLGEVARQADELERRLAKANVAILDGPNGEFKDIDPDAHPVSSVADLVIAELGETPDASLQDMMLGVRSRLQTSDPDTFALVAPHIDEAVTINGQIEALESQYGEAMAAHRDEAIVRLAANVNWDKMVDVLIDGGEWPEGTSVSKDVALNRMLSVVFSRHSDNLSNMHHDAEAAEGLFSIAASIDGGVLEAPLPEPPDGWFTQQNVSDAIGQWEKSTETAITYMDGHRRSKATSLLYQAELFPITSLAHRWRMDGTQNVTILAPVADACMRRAERQFQQFDNQEAKATLEDAHSRPNTLYVGTANRDKLAQNADIADVPAWVNRRLNRFGPRLSGGIGFIEFTDDDRSNHGVDDSDVHLVTGEQKPRENALYIDVRTGTHDDYQAFVASLNNDPALAHGVVRHNIQETFDHEVAHHIHGASLTAAELREWQGIVERNPDLGVDGYITSLLGKGAPDSRIRVERFANSVSSYMNDPLRQALEHGEGFTFLNNLIGRYDTSIVSALAAPVDELRRKGRNDEADRQLLFRTLALTNALD